LDVFAFVPASTAVVGPREVLDRLGEPDARRLVRAEIDQIIAAEAPIELGRLARITGRRFGLDRVRQSRAEEIAALVPDELVVKTRFGGFVWRSEHHHETWAGYRRSTSTADRPLIEVAPEELVNAMRKSVIAEGALTETELVGIVANLFGLSRVTAQPRKHLGRVIGWAVKAGKLTLADGVVDIPRA
jgi:hypothetical protein